MLSHSASRESVDVDVDVDDHERTSLFPQPPQDAGLGAGQTDDTKSDRVLILLYATTLLLYLGQNITPAPVTEIYQSIICHHQQHIEGSRAMMVNPVLWAQDPRCKSLQVQQELARIEGVERLLGAVPTVLAIPYGVAADKHGRSFILTLSIIGVLLEQLWAVMVCSYPDSLPLRLVWFGPAFEVIGGGMGVASSMIHIIVADAVIASLRTQVFFRLHAAGIAAAMIAQSTASALMMRDVWIPWYLGLACTSLACGTSLLIPNTSGSCSKAVIIDANVDPFVDDTIGRNPKARNLREKVSSAMTSLKATIPIFASNSRVTLLLILIFMSQLGSNVVSTVLLLYISKRFDWSFAKANMLWFLGEGVELTMLILVIPFATGLVLARHKLSVGRKDHLVALFCSCTYAIGVFTLGFAPTATVATLAFMVRSMGTGIIDVLRSLLTLEIEPQHMSVVYSTMTVLNVLGSSIAGPLYSETFAAGFEIGITWTGLPFLISGGLFLIITLALLHLRPRHGKFEALEGLNNE